MKRRPQWIFRFLHLRMEGRGMLPTREGDIPMEDGDMVGLIHPDLKVEDAERLDRFLNSQAFIAAFLPEATR